jgi:hypothetical protein
MPNCFQLTPIGSNEPEPLQTIDNRMWVELGNTKPSKTKWFCGWYNIIGFALACGHDFEHIRNTLKSQMETALDSELEHYNTLVTITNWLQDHYTANAWYSHK